jgi:hypothetical protein
LNAAALEKKPKVGSLVVPEDGVEYCHAQIVRRVEANVRSRVMLRVVDLN